MLKNMKVSAKLISGFLAVALLTVIVGGIGVFGLIQLKAANDDMYENNLKAISYLGDLRELYQQQRVLLRDVVLFTDEGGEQLQAVIRQFDDIESALKVAIEGYSHTITEKQAEASYFKAIDVLFGPYLETKNAVIEASLAGDATKAHTIIKEAGPLVDTITKGLAESSQYNAALATKTKDNDAALAMGLIITQSLVMVASLCAAICLGLYISGLISKPMRYLSGFAAEVAKTGNLHLLEENKEEIKKYSAQTDEIGATVIAVNELMKMMEVQADILQRIADKDLSQTIVPLSEKCTLDAIAIRMLDSMNDVLYNIQLSAGQVSTGAQQMSDGAQALAQGATQQASTVEELSASLSEIAEKTRNNAKLAANAAELGLAISSKAEKGSEQMSDMVNSVKEISEASYSISNVIKVIDDIAFQTNILALNAAVEAARAGAHGKGFAVVADEVRNLAAKSSEAAKTTSNLIEQTIKKAKDGVTVAEETAQRLEEIVHGINERGGIVKEIASASEEQSLAISQVNEGIDQVAQVVQQNSATSQQSAAVSQEMAAQAQMLNQQASLFRLRGDIDITSRQLRAPHDDVAETYTTPQLSAPVFTSPADDGGIIF